MIKCPLCNIRTYVINIRRSEGFIRRRRVCHKCKRRFSTKETYLPAEPEKDTELTAFIDQKVSEYVTRYKSKRRNIKVLTKFSEFLLSEFTKSREKHENAC